MSKKKAPSLQPAPKPKSVAKLNSQTFDFGSGKFSKIDFETWITKCRHNGVNEYIANPEKYEVKFDKEAMESLLLATFKDIRFSKIDLSYIDFSMNLRMEKEKVVRTFENCIFDKVNLTGAIFRGVHFKNVVFSGGDCKEADFTGCLFENTEVEKGFTFEKCRFWGNIGVNFQTSLVNCTTDTKDAK